MHIILLYLWEGILLILSALVLTFFSTLFHEAGHLAMYLILFKENDWHITIGKGNPILKWKRLSINANVLSFGRGYFRFSAQSLSNWKYILILLAGPVFTLMLIFSFSKISVFIEAHKDFLFYPGFSWLCGMGFWINIFMFFITILPLSMSEYTSDGMKVINLIRGK